MKFGKLLRGYIEETVPDWKEKYLKYKQLKRTLKTLPQLAQDVLKDEEAGTLRSSGWSPLPCTAGPVRTRMKIGDSSVNTDGKLTHASPRPVRVPPASPRCSLSPDSQRTPTSHTCNRRTS